MPRRLPCSALCGEEQCENIQRAECPAHRDNDQQSERIQDSPSQTKCPARSVERAFAFAQMCGGHKLAGHLICSEIVNNRMLAQVNTFQDDAPLSRIIDKVCRGAKGNGRRYHGLDLTGKDRALPQTISDPVFEISGITNRALRTNLRDLPENKNRTERQLSGYVSRQLRFLRDHSLIRKMHRQNLYRLTKLGRELAMSTKAILNASIEGLMENAA